jgi:hypothetical protein
MIAVSLLYDGAAKTNSQLLQLINDRASQVQERYYVVD